MLINCFIGKFNADIAVEQGRGLRMVSMEELRCVICGKKLEGKSCKIYRSPANEELKLCICTEHEDYIKALDALELPSRENKP